MAKHRTDEASGLSAIHSFIIQIWLEEPEVEAHRPTWRGHITHLPVGERHYFKKLDEISAYIEAHLKINSESV